MDFAVDDFFTRSDVFYDVSITGLREVINSCNPINQLVSGDVARRLAYWLVKNAEIIEEW